MLACFAIGRGLKGGRWKNAPLMPEDKKQVEKMTQARLDSLDSKGGDRRRYGDNIYGGKGWLDGGDITYIRSIIT